MDNIKESMIVYESAYKAICFLPDEQQRWEAIEGLMRYGFYDEEPESENPFVKMVYVQAIPSMRSAKERYARAVENGKKGGRPSSIKDEDIIALKEDGKTNKEIAEHFGCSEKNIEARVTKIKKESEKQPEPVPDRRANNKKNTLEDLDDLQLEALEEMLEVYTPYPDIYKEFNLANNLVNKNTLSKVRDEKKRREEVEIAIYNGTYFDDESQEQQEFQEKHESLEIKDLQNRFENFYQDRKNDYYNPENIQELQQLHDYAKKNGLYADDMYELLKLVQRGEKYIEYDMEELPFN